MRNKKGSHVGMILSFLVFITFLAFLYSVIEPATRSQEDKRDLINYLEVELVNEFTADMSTIIFRVPSKNNCFQFNTEEGLKTSNVVAKNESDFVFPSGTSSSDTFVQYGYGDVLKLYYSGEFPGSSDISPCNKLIKGIDYDISLFKTTEDIFESRILNLSNYLKDNANYEQFKIDKDIGVGNEFGFVFSDEDKNPVAGTEEKNVSTDIFVQELPIQYIDSKANIKSGFLNIRVW